MHKTLGVILIAVLVTLGLNAYSLIKKGNLPAGSVNVGNEYSYVSYEPLSTAAQVLKKTGGTLGSLVVTGANTGTLVLYQATTTDATKRATAATTSLPIITQFPASVAAGTYTFDISFNTGLLAVWTGTIATSTLTYR